MYVGGLLVASVGAIGLISTHDLALTDISGLPEGALMNVHFQDELQDGRMSFDFKLREGVEFHHGKTLTAEDVMFSLAKVTDPKKPGSGGTELAKFLDLKNSKIVDSKTIVLQLSAPYAVLDQLLAEYTVGILPTDFDVSHPVGISAVTFKASQSASASLLPC